MPGDSKYIDEHTAGLPGKEVRTVDDSQIIDLFFARSELAISELDAKYGKVCHKLAHNILDSRQDAEECVNDAYLGTWNAIPP